MGNRLSLPVRSLRTSKTAFITAPLLRHIKPRNPAIMETDSSNFAVRGENRPRCRTTMANDILWRTNPASSSPAEMNYAIPDKELVAIVDCFSRWPRYLEGSEHCTTVYTDHYNFEYFTAKALNRRQAKMGRSSCSP